MDTHHTDQSDRLGKSVDVFQSTRRLIGAVTNAGTILPRPDGRLIHAVRRKGGNDEDCSVYGVGRFWNKWSGMWSRAARDYFGGLGGK